MLLHSPALSSSSFLNFLNVLLQFFIEFCPFDTWVLTLSLSNLSPFPYWCTHTNSLCLPLHSVSLPLRFTLHPNGSHQLSLFIILPAQTILCGCDRDPTETNLTKTITLVYISKIPWWLPVSVLGGYLFLSHTHSKDTLHKGPHTVVVLSACDNW